MAEKQTTALTATQAKLAAIEDRFEALDVAGKNLRELVRADDGSPSHAIRQAAAMSTLRELLTPEVMAPIMALQGTPLGFKTDKDSQGGYGVDVVRDCAIEAIGRGAAMTCNRFNIIAARCYLTKEHMQDALDAAQGRGRWMLVHGVPQTVRGVVTRKDKATGKMVQYEGVIGATVESTVKWIDGDDWKSETLRHAIKGDDYASADSYLGKADRKCGAWLLARVTGERVPEGDAEEVIDVTATASDRPAPESRLKGKREKADAAPAAEAQDETKAEPAASAVPCKVEAAIAAMDAKGVPRAFLLAWLRHRKTLTAEQGISDLPQDAIAYMVEHPDDVARAVSEFADKQG